MRWILAFLMCLASRPADACSSLYVDLFTRFDAASAVVIGRSGTSTAAILPVAVESTLKGTADKPIGFDQRARCGRILQRKRHVIAFVNAKSRVFDFTPWSAATEDAIVRWSALAGGTNRARLELLAALGKSKNRELAKAARARRGIELRRRP